jgi:hypothetical protein
MRFYLLIALLLVLITACKKKEDPKTDEQETPATVAPAGNHTTTPTPTTAPSPTTIPTPTISTPTIDYRDSITGTYLVTFTVSFKQTVNIVTRTITVRKSNPDEHPIMEPYARQDSCVTVESVYLPQNGAPYASVLTSRLRPDFLGNSYYNTVLDLKQKKFYFLLGCCGCGSAGCSSVGIGAKIP